MRFRTTFRTIWKIDSLIILVGGAGICIMLGVLAFQVIRDRLRTHQKEDTVNVESSVGTSWRLGAFEKISGYMVAPVYSAQSYSVSLYGKQASAVRNYLFVNLEDKSSRWLIPTNDHLIVSMERLAADGTSARWADSTGSVPEVAYRLPSCRQVPARAGPTLFNLNAEATTWISILDLIPYRLKAAGCRFPMGDSNPSLNGFGLKALAGIAAARRGAARSQSRENGVTLTTLQESFALLARGECAARSGDAAVNPGLAAARTQSGCAHAGARLHDARVSGHNAGANNRAGDAHTKAPTAPSKSALTPVPAHQPLVPRVSQRVRELQEAGHPVRPELLRRRRYTARELRLAWWRVERPVSRSGAEPDPIGQAIRRHALKLISGAAAAGLGERVDVRP